MPPFGAARSRWDVPGRRWSTASIPSRPGAGPQLVVDDALQRKAGRADPIASRDDDVVAPGSRYIDWLIPGLLGMNIMGTSLWSIGFSVVVARSRKLLKRLMATPMPRSQYLLSHLLSRLVFLTLEAAALLTFAYFVFGVAPVGSIAMVGGLCCSGRCVLPWPADRDTVDHNRGLWGGCTRDDAVWLCPAYSARRRNYRTGPAVHPLLPLTALVDALRAVYLDGHGPAAIGREIATLTIYTAATFGLSVKLFRWR